MKTRLRLLGLALPMIALVFMIGQAEWRLTHSETWTFSMRGYDPRDLLRGHYLLFQLQIEPQPATPDAPGCDTSREECCYCLTPGAEIPDIGFDTLLESRSCEVAPSVCSAFVRAKPLHALRRFYIPESHREMLEARLFEAQQADRAHLVVAVDADGRPQISQLLLYGESIDRVVEGPVGTTEPL